MGLTETRMAILLSQVDILETRNQAISGYVHNSNFSLEIAVNLEHIRLLRERIGLIETVVKALERNPPSFLGQYDHPSEPPRFDEIQKPLGEYDQQSE